MSYHSTDCTICDSSSCEDCTVDVTQGPHPRLSSNDIREMWLFGLNVGDRVAIQNGGYSASNSWHYDKIKHITPSRARFDLESGSKVNIDGRSFRDRSNRFSGLHSWEIEPITKEIVAANRLHDALDLIQMFCLDRNGWKRLSMKDLEVITDIIKKYPKEDK